MSSTLYELLRRRRPRVTLLLGASDTGKTTLLEQCLAERDDSGPLAVVDCDVGQSHLGPPTTIGWGVIPLPFTGWRHVEVAGFAFTGAVSPEGNVETFLDAAGRMVEAAGRHAASVVVDTTGLVDGELGRTLKRRKVERLRPDLIVAVQREGELEALLQALPSVSIERLPAPPACTRRNLAQRAAYRDAQLARYFANSVMQRVSLRDVSLTGVGPDWPGGRVTVSPAALMDCVVGLRSARGEDLALGLVRDVGHEPPALTLLTPQRDAADVTALVAGSIRWPSPKADPALALQG
ncbi:MAG: hypothetical protein HYY91_00450 [Candidatus Omnitrophica bacterium]|nr:hypothetical protein [Candidatus Omnitrophota bacterium]